VLRFAFIPAQLFSRRPLTQNWRSQRRFLRCASGAGGRTCHSEAARMGWRGVLAQRTPPHRAAAKRRRGTGQGWLREGREWRSLRSPSGRLTAQRRPCREPVRGIPNKREETRLQEREYGATPTVGCTVRRDVDIQMTIVLQLEAP